MNPTTQSGTKSPVDWSRLAWGPILLLLVAILAARMAGLRESYESRTLMLVLGFTFYTLVSLGTLYLIGRSFLASGSPGLLLLECGMVLWSLAGTVGDFVSHGDANINVTIFNVSILLAGLCHLAGAILALRPQRAFRMRSLWLGAGFALALGALWLVSQAALSGWLPVFFIPGHGGTPVRYIVLISAITLFALSAALLKVSQRAARLPFTSWYALALLMLAVGLFGIMIQLSLGSVVNWLSRAAQWLGGTYLLIAALASLRESQLPLLPLENKSRPAYYRDAVAVALVIAAAAIRLAFLSAMGARAPFLLFYPAVMFAAIYGGWRSGLLATALSAILANYFWFEPVNQFTIRQHSDWLALAIFLLSGAMIAWVADSMHRARARAFAAETQALLALEREKTAEALLEGRAKLEAALASMTDAVFISDVKGRFIEFNDAFATFHRFRGKADCAKTLAEYPDFLEVFMADGTPAPLGMWAVPRALRGETVTNAEYALRRKDTGETWVGSYSFGPIRDKDGVIVGSVVVGRDITELKRAEETLRQSEERYRMLFNTMIEGFCIIEVIFDSDGRAVDYRLLEINPAFEAQTGLKNPKGRLIRELAPENEAYWFEIYGKIALTGEPARFVNEAKALNRWFDVSAYRVGKPENRQVAIVFNDITDRKMAEEKLQKAYGELEDRVKDRTEELSRINKELTLSGQRLQHLSTRLLEAQEEERRRFAGEVHDSFSASLSAIKFKIEALQKEDGTKHGDFENLKNQVQDLIEESRRIQVALRPSILDDLGIVAALTWFTREFQKTYSHMEVTKEIGIKEDDVPDRLKTTIFRISQESFNNAAKHSKAEGLNLSLVKRDSILQLEIQDNGIGFGIKSLEAGEHSPRGLGLSSMEERASLSGGVFSIHSEAGKGTTIRVSWPLGGSI